jgi:hypothetical protein
MSKIIEFFLGSILITILSIALMVFSALNYVLRVVDIPGCAWHTSVRAWIDSNGDGFVNKDEPPLGNVVIHVDDVNHQLDDVGWPAVTDQNGDTQIDVPVRGCSDTVFEVYANVPEGYRITTKPRVQINRNFWGSLFAPHIYYFGFVPEK